MDHILHYRSSLANPFSDSNFPLKGCRSAPPSGGNDMSSTQGCAYFFTRLHAVVNRARKQNSYFLKAVVRNISECSESSPIC